MSTVSVVMPVLNGARYIEEAARSALDQGPHVIELIVVDDASTDNTRAVVEAIGDPRIRIVPNRTRGLPAGRNTGAALATGEWLNFLDSDDRIRPGGLAALLAAVADDPETVLVYGDYERIDSNGAVLGGRRLIHGRRKPTGDVLRAILRRNFMTVGAQLVRRDAYERSGRFVETLPYCEDWHFWCRLAAHGPYRHVPGLYAVDYRIHNTSMMHAKVRTMADFRPAVDAVFSDPAIVARLSPVALAAFRRAAEAGLMTYIATEAIRLHSYPLALRSTAQALLRAPRQAPDVMLRVCGAVAGM